MDPIAITLEARAARLEPLSLAHAADLLAAGSEPEIWRYLPCVRPRSLAEIEAWIDVALRAQDAGESLPFAIVECKSGRAVGSTRYLDIRRAHRGLEIGWTWLAPAVQRTAINTECKWMLLRHAFEDLGALRVQLKTDGRNLKSQRAIERLGAAREGLLRKHVIMPDGYERDTVMYSILRDEWPRVRDGLRAKLERPGDAPAPPS